MLARFHEKSEIRHQRNIVVTVQMDLTLTMHKHHTEAKM